MRGKGWLNGFRRAGWGAAIKRGAVRRALWGVAAVAILAGMVAPAQAETTGASDRLRFEQFRQAAAIQLARDPDNRQLRFDLAAASYRAGQHGSAKYHLRVLMRDTGSAEELAQLKRSYGMVQRDRPWAFGLNFALLPSSNINRRSSNEFFETDFGRLLITGGGQQKSGLGLRFGANVSRTGVLDNGDLVTLLLDANRSRYPEARLNRDDVTFQAVWSRRVVGGATTVSPFVTRFLHDDKDATSSADWTRYGLRVSHEHYLDRRRSITGTLSLEQRDYDDLTYLDGPQGSLGLSYRAVTQGGLLLRYGATVTRAKPRQQHLRYNGLSLWGEVTRPVRGIGNIGLLANLGARNYDTDFPLLGAPRRDRNAGIGMSFSTPRLVVFDTTPRLTCQYHRNMSNVALYEFASTDCSITFDRQF